MKRIKIFSILTLIVVFTACKNNFLDVTPMDRYSDATVWTDPALVTSFVDNIYEGQQYGFQVEMLASLTDIAMTKRLEAQAIVRSNINAGYLSVFAPDYFVDSYRNITWNNLYKNIRSCNVFFENIDKSGLKGPDIERLKGEVHFLRAYFYSWLMSFWGGVPLIDKAYAPDDNLLVARNTLAETVNFIVADCDTAATLLPVTGDKARATKGAALALKSRVLLYAASDLYNSQASWSPGYAHPELVSYIGGDRTARWQAAKDAAKAVIDLGVYSLYGGTNPASPEEATANYANMFLNNGNDEDIFLCFYDNVNRTDWQTPAPGLFYGPNGYHNWGNNTPLQRFVDSYEMIDGSKFSWANPTEAAAPYKNRDPRFYATVLYDGAKWRKRPDDVIGSDPEGIVQTGFYENADGSYTPGLDTRQSAVEDWNGTYTGYYLRKFIDPTIDHQYEKQKLPWRQFRYAEVLLNYAEACLELGQEAEAKKYIDMIRARAGMPPIPADVTGDALMARYRNERKIELAFEEQRYFDIRRWMIAPDVMLDGKGIDIRYPYGSNTPNYKVVNIEYEKRVWKNKVYFLPILQDELNRNDSLIQNPGY